MEENFHQPVLSRPNTHSPLTSSEAVQIVELLGTDCLFYFWLCYQILVIRTQKGKKECKSVSHFNSSICTNTNFKNWPEGLFFYICYYGLYVDKIVTKVHDLRKNCREFHSQPRTFSMNHSFPAEERKVLSI